ncbi:MAG: outer membrane lipoprotein [Acidiferrobacter sp.]
MTIKTLTAVLVALTLAGCAVPPQNAILYSGRSTMQPQRVLIGTVIAVRPIQIRVGSRNGPNGALAGGLGGAGIGAILGNSRGAVVGALAGGALGDFIGSQQTLPGELVTVQLRNGQMRAFPQPLAPHETPLRNGEQVEVLVSPEGRYRVLPLH